MQSQIKFFPGSFPILGAKWLDLARPHLNAYIKTRDAFAQLRGHPRHERLIRWYRKQTDLLWQIQEQMEECASEYATRIFLREAADASVQLGVPTHTMLSFVAMTLMEVFAVLYGGSAAVDETASDTDDRGAGAERFRETCLRAISERISHSRVTPAAKACCEWLQTWIRNADGTRLRGMHGSLFDNDVVEAVIRDGVASSVFAADEVDAMARHMAALERERRQVQSNYEGIHTRIERMKGHVLAPLDAAEAVATPWGIVRMLVDALRASVIVALGPTTDVEPVHLQFAQPRWSGRLEEASIDTMFWYVGMTSLLRSSGAMLGRGLKKWAVELIVMAIDHPKQVRRAAVPAEGIGTRAVLSKWIAPMLKGYHPLVDAAGTIRQLGPGRSDEGLVVFANYLAHASARADGIAEYRSAEHQRAAEYLWVSIVGPAHAEIIQWIANAMDVAADVVSMQEPESPEQEVAAHAEAVASSPEALPEAVELAEEKQVETWYYVANPAAPALTLMPVELDPDDRESLFTRFLRNHGINPLVKPASILGALDYFRDMSATLRAITPYDDLGTQRWHKLKRGGLRIYIRIEADGRKLFSLLLRRDWRPDLVTYARSAA